MRTGSRPDKRTLPRWARIAVAVLSPTAVLLYLGFLALAVVNAALSGGGFGVSTGTEWLAVTMTVVNGFILAVAVFAVPWLYPTGKRALIALAAGTLFGLVGAAVTHG